MEGVIFDTGKNKEIEMDEFDTLGMASNDFIPSSFSYSAQIGRLTFTCVYPRTIHQRVRYSAIVQHRLPFHIKFIRRRWCQIIWKS